jgi:hypothetical protein
MVDLILLMMEKGAMIMEEQDEFPDVLLKVNVRVWVRIRVRARIRVRVRVRVRISILEETIAKLYPNANPNRLLC